MTASGREGLDERRDGGREGGAQLGGGQGAKGKRMPAPQPRVRVLRGHSWPRHHACRPTPRAAAPRSGPCPEGWRTAPPSPTAPAPPPRRQQRLRRRRPPRRRQRPARCQPPCCRRPCCRPRCRRPCCRRPPRSRRGRAAAAPPPRRARSAPSGAYGEAPGDLGRSGELWRDLLGRVLDAVVEGGEAAERRLRTARHPHRRAHLEHATDADC